MKTSEKLFDIYYLTKKLLEQGWTMNEIRSFVFEEEQQKLVQEQEKEKEVKEVKSTSNKEEEILNEIKKLNKDFNELKKSSDKDLFGIIENDAESEKLPF